MSGKGQGKTKNQLIKQELIQATNHFKVRINKQSIKDKRAIHVIQFY